MKLKVPGDRVIVRYASGGRFVGVPGVDPVEIDVSGIRWLLRDEFNTTDASPITTPRNAEPGPGIAAIRDIEEEIAIAAGWIEFTPQAVSPVYAEQDVVYSTPVITRAAGIGILNKFRCSGDGAFYPLALVTSATPTWNATHVEAAFHRAGTALSLTATCNAAAGPIVFVFVADSTEYRLALITDAVGQRYYIKGGALTNWTLVYRCATSATASLYAAMGGYSASYGASFIRQFPVAITTTPLLSFTGAMTWPTTNVAPVLTMLDMGTWAAGGTYVVNTPVTGAEKNGNAELSVNTTTWGPSNYTLSREDSESDPGVNSGGTDKWCLKCDATAASSRSASFTLITSANIWFRSSLRYYIPTGDPSL